MRRGTGEAGFTLIEVLVASAILMSSTGVLMQLFSSGLDRTQRAGQVAHLLVAQRLVVQRLEEVNPALQGDGKGVAEGLAYRWKVSIQEPFRPFRVSDTMSPREAALFTITVEMDTPRGGKSNFSADRLGWRNVR